MKPLRPTAKITDAPFHADPTGARDSTAAIQACVLEAESIEVPPGRYRIRHSQTLKVGPQFTDHVGVIIPADGTPRRIWGHGSASRFLTELDDPTQPELAQDAGRDNTISWFWLEAGLTGVDFDRVWFEGQAPANLEFGQFIPNLQMTAIDCSPPSGKTEPPRDVGIRNCGFTRQFGFSVHARGGVRGITVLDSDFVDCMNGLNLNADNAKYALNRFLRSEGIEHTGSNAKILANDFRRFYSVAVAYGGNTSARSPENLSLDGQIIGNTADEGSHYGWVISMNTAGTLLERNTLSRTLHHGLVIGANAPRAIQPEHVRVSQCDFIDCGGPTEAAAMLIGGGSRNIQIRRNSARYGVYAGYNQQWGLHVGDSEDVTVEDNELTGRHAGLSVYADAKRFRHSGNRVSRLDIDPRADVIQGRER